MLQRRKKNAGYLGDDSTTKLVDEGVYRLEEKGKRAPKEKHYGFWSAVKAISLLAAVLWWLPTIGQMIAGYAGGRRAPSPWKATLAAMIPVSIIFAITYAYDHGIMTAQISTIYGLPSSMATGVSSILPFAAPYITFASNYMDALINFLNSSVGFWLNGFLVTLIFAYIGGLASQKERVELEYRKKFALLLPQSLRNSHKSILDSLSPNAWYVRSDDRLDNLTRLGGEIYSDRDVPSSKKYKRLAASSAAQARSKKRVDPKILAELEAVAGAPAEEPGKKSGLSREVLSERMVERALRNYQGAKRMDSKHRA